MLGVRPHYCLEDRLLSRTTIRALLKVTNLNGLNDRPDKWKEIPLIMMSSSLRFADSLRLLLYAALIDRHVVGASSRHEFEILISQYDTDAGMLVLFRDSSH